MIADEFVLIAWRAARHSARFPCCLICFTLLGLAAMNSRSIVLLVCLFSLGFLPVLMTPRAVQAAVGEEALIAKIKLNAGNLGSAEEIQRISDLEDQLEKALKAANAGEFDGDEYGEGFCTIYLFGPSAERLAKVALPILKNFRAPARSFVIKRYGKPGAKQERIELGKE